MATVCVCFSLLVLTRVLLSDSSSQSVGPFQIYYLKAECSLDWLSLCQSIADSLTPAQSRTASAPERWFIGVK